MVDIVLSGSGLDHPTDVITNEELVASFNTYVRKFNEEHAEDIANGKIEALKESDADFIYKASGIKQRYSRTKKDTLDPNVMWTYIKSRPDNELSLQAEYGLAAAKQALANANKKPEDVDVVIVSSSTKQRSYPAIAIEIQHALGIKGFAFDMNVACSSATFGIQMAVDTIKAGHARAVLVISPEANVAHVDYHDRDSHFIFGDASVATLIERADLSQSKHQFKIIDTYLHTEFSNVIRNNQGNYDRADPDTMFARDKLFYQEGRRVFKEVAPLVVQTIQDRLAKQNLSVENIKRFWMHQANGNMNRYICERLLGEGFDPVRAPIILDEFANTASAGSIIAFHRYHNDIKPNEYGFLCSFGAGYSIGAITLQRI